MKHLLRTLAAVLTGTLLLSGCSIYDLPLPGGAKTGDNPMKVTLMFRDVLDLVPQSSVKVNDVTVGKVTEVKLKGYVAKVTVELPRTIDLPANTNATIRQTSLLGEKFVSLAPPSQPNSAKLTNGSTIGLDHTGRNPEVEEVLGALALLLNGGGVGQLKTIFSELNNALDGREDEVRSVLDQIRVFVGQLDDNKQSVVAALENTNRLAVQLRKQDGTIKATLDNVPSALASINRQRDDLVKLLQSLTKLSNVGVRVIQASKASTINSLRDLAPVLQGFADAGENFPKSLQVYLTYPFVDEAVGRDPQVARNLHMGDFTNLAVNLDLKLDQIALPSIPNPIPTEVCNLTKTIRAEVKKQVEQLPSLPGGLGEKELIDAITEAVTGVTCASDANAIKNAVAKALYKILASPLVTKLCPKNSTNPLCQILNGPLPSTGVPSIPGLPVPTGVGGSLGGLGGVLPRTGLNEYYQVPGSIDPFHVAAKGYDPGIGTLLFQGVATQR